MKWSRIFAPKDANYFVPGDWNMEDDRFGGKTKASQTTKQWDGFRSKGSQKRHEQDFLRGIKETIRTPWARPIRKTVFVNRDADLTNGQFKDDSGWRFSASASTRSWSIANGYATYTAGSTDTMYQGVNAVSGAVYEVVFTIYAYVGAGSITASIGTTSGTARIGDGTYTEQITSGGTNPGRLTFTPGAGGTSFNLDDVRVLRVG